MTDAGGLGRIYVPDERDHAYAITLPTPAVRSYRYWRDGPLLDQGQTPSCVGHAWKNWLDGTPVRDPLAKPPSAMEIYAWANAHDGISGGHDGTSVRAGAQYLQSLGKISSYHWAESADDALAYLLGTSPVVLGVNWYQGFDTPSSEGIVRISGGIRGGHAFLADGFNKSRGLVRAWNSWGMWGKKGHFFFSAEDLARLLGEQGECCAALEMP